MYEFQTHDTEPISHMTALNAYTHISVHHMFTELMIHMLFVLKIRNA